MVQCNILGNCCWWDLLKTPAACALLSGASSHRPRLSHRSTVKRQTRRLSHRDYCVSCRVVAVVVYIIQVRLKSSFMCHLKLKVLHQKNPNRLLAVLDARRNSKKNTPMRTNKVLNI